MLLLACMLLIAGYTLAYAGVRGIYWQQPWLLLVNGSPPNPSGPAPVSGVGSIAEGRPGLSAS